MKKIKFFKKDILTIAKKVVSSTDSFIQIKNITRIWHGRPDVDVPYFKIFLLFIVGAGAKGIGGFGFISIPLYLIAIGLSAFYIYLACQYTLNFELSSGQVYAFTSNKDFILESYNKIKEIISQQNIGDEIYKFNFDSCKFDIVSGNNNEITKGENIIVNKGDNNSFQVNQTDNSHKTENINSFNQTQVINYQNISKELTDLIKQLNEQEDATDIEVLKEAQKNAKEQDEKGLKETMSHLSEKIFDMVSKTSSLVTIADFISKFM